MKKKDKMLLSEMFDDDWKKLPTPELMKKLRLAAHRAGLSDIETAISLLENPGDEYIAQAKQYLVRALERLK